MPETAAESYLAADESLLAPASLEALGGADARLGLLARRGAGAVALAVLEAPVGLHTNVNTGCFFRVMDICLYVRGRSCR